MSESFVDLTYRGLQLGRRVKLTQVRPSSGYLELPTPMPVGTAIAIATDEGVVLDAIVTGVHEQVGGSDRPPGMTVRPVFDTAAGQAAPGDPSAWWRARVVLSDEGAPAANNGPVTVRPRTRTVPEPQPDAPSAPVAELPIRRTGQHAVVDDGRTTMVTEIVDPEALGLDDSAPDDAEHDGNSNGGDDKKSPGGVKKRRKKR